LRKRKSPSGVQNSEFCTPAPRVDAAKLDARRNAAVQN
jgi:hypothetical protein